MKPLNLRGIRKINSFEDGVFQLELLESMIFDHVVDGEGRRFIVIRVE